MEPEVGEIHPSSNEGTSETKIYGTKDYFNAANGDRIIVKTGRFCFVCCICDKKFRKRILILRHVKLIHQIEVKIAHRNCEKPSECEHCGKSFTQLNNLYRHMRSTHGVQHSSYKGTYDMDEGEACPLCNKVFATINTVNIHVRKHHKFAINSKNAPSSSRFQSCSFCDLTFAEESTCASHMKNYHNALHRLKEADGELEEIYECALCNVEINDKANLKSHLAESHQKDLRENAIEIRDEIEEEEDTRETFNCDGCSKSYEHESEWTSHMEEEHAAIPEACCRRCGDFSSKTIYDLKCHMEKVHSETASAEMSSLRPRKSGTLGLTRQELLGMEKIPRWLVNHGKGQILVVLQRNL